MKLEQIQESIKNAMKCHATLQVETLRSVVAAVKKAAIDKRCEITDELVDEILLKEVKIIQEQIDTCPAARSDLLEEYEHRLAIVNVHAPKLITDPVKIAEWIETILDSAGIVVETANKGIIMKTIMPVVKGKVDMAVVNKVVANLIK